MLRNNIHSSVNSIFNGRMIILLCLLLALFCLMFFMQVLPARAYTVVGGPITSDTTWDMEGSPYIVATESVSVTQGVTLTIDPGVIVRFNPTLILWVDGTLIARGTASSPITFTSNQPNPGPGDWGNIDFRHSTVNTVVDSNGNYISGSILQHCVIEYGGNDGVQDQNAVYAFGTSLMVDNCRIRNNSGSGIMVYRDESSYLSWITNNTIQNNTAYGLGGGIILGSGVIKENTIINNKADYGVDGGGIYAFNADIISNTITSNTTKDTPGTEGAGIFIETNTSDTYLIQGNVIQDNLGVNYGGGIYIKTGPNGPQFIVRQNLIRGNSATADGGGIYVRGGSGSVTIQENIILDNIAESRLDKFGGGGILVDSTGAEFEIEILENIINGNSANFNGGGIYIIGDMGTVTARDNYISGNIADSDANDTGSGGGIYCMYKNGVHSLQDNLITENSAGDSGGGIYTDDCLISGNVVTNNSAVNIGGGIVSSGDILSNTISTNNLTAVNALGSGVLLEGSGEFELNSVVDNAGESGSLLTGGLQITGTPEVHHNNLYGNFPYNVVVDSAQQVSGTLNYWDTDDIVASIYDKTDDDSRGEFVYDPYSTEPEFPVPLSPPTGLTATLIDDQVQLEWDLDPHFALGWGYNVYYDKDTFLPPFDGYGLGGGDSPIDVGDQTQVLLSNLAPNTDYYFAVTVYDDIDRESDYAVVLVDQPDTTVPDMPAGLTATLMGDQVELEWDMDPNFSDGWSYEVGYDTDSWLPPFEGTGLCEGDSPINVGDQTNVVLSCLEPDITYYFGVRVFNDLGIPSDFATVTVEQPGLGSKVSYLPLIQR